MRSHSVQRYSTALFRSESHAVLQVGELLPHFCWFLMYTLYSTDTSMLKTLKACACFLFLVLTFPLPAMFFPETSTRISHLFI